MIVTPPRRFISGLVIAVAMAGSAQAAEFTLGPLTMTLPADFHCSTQNNLAVCQSRTGPKMKDAILIAVVKAAGPQDTLQEYQRQMAQPRSIQNKQKVPQLSKVLKTQTVQINGHTWVESQHQNSEIDGYTTTYWATAAGNVALLVNYSFHPRRANAAQTDIAALRQGLRLDVTAATQVAGASPVGPEASGAMLRGSPAVSHGSHIEVAGMQVKKTHLYLLGGLVAALLLLAAVLKRR